MDICKDDSKESILLAGTVLTAKDAQCVSLTRLILLCSQTGLLFDSVSFTGDPKYR